MMYFRVVNSACAVLLVAAMGVSAAQTQPEFHHVQGGIVHGLFFLDSLKGWTAEDGGRIRWTDDGGLTWEYATVPNSTEETRVILRGIFFLDQHTGWAVGDGGVVLKTTPDTFGQEWVDGNPFDRVTDSRDQPLPCDQNLASLYDIFMINANVGWVVGNDGALRKTIDGGSSWGSPHV